MDNLISFSKIALFLVFSACASADPIFKWVDEHGVTHYSAGNPKDKKAQQVKVPSASPSAGDTSQRTSVREWEMSENLKKRKQQQEKQEEAESQVKEEKARRCEAARQRLGVLQEQIPIYSRNNKGEREYWDDNTRESEIKKTKEVISSDC